WPKTYTFDWINDDLIQNHMTVRDGRIELPSGVAYGVLHVAPRPHGTMPLATAKKIAAMVEQGATVVLAGKPPKRCPGLVGYPQSDKTLRKIVDRLWSNSQTIKLPKDDRFALMAIVEASPQRPIWRLENSKPLRFLHRRTNDSDIVLVVNRDTSRVDEPVVFRSRRPVVELWDATTGEIRRADFTKTKDGISVRVCLPASNSVFVVLRDRPTPGALPPRQPMQPTSTIAIAGPWELRFPKGWGAPELVALDKLESWTTMEHPDVKAFSGVATYRTEFDVSKEAAEAKRAVLDLGNVQELCEARLNGKIIGAAWHAPYRFEAATKLKPGKNTLEIRVANLWSNRLAADWALPKEKRRSRMLPEKTYTRFKKTKPLPSGLMGPVKLLLE
ncbi:MAG: glycosyl hydrolase, partial [Planctomycetota bacterium]|nr:glycosyl hydrolase [Planctomycetota bacterium]